MVDQGEPSFLTFPSSHHSNSVQGKLCPAPDCNYAVLCSDVGEGNVTCRCLHSNFCWSCSGEDHAPVDCFTLSRWMSEKDSKSEEWLLAYATSCPKCPAAPKERSDVCHEKCISCGHEYCSNCGDDWNKNGIESYDETHSCNAESGLTGLFKDSLQRYHKYNTKWATCEESRENTLAILKSLQEGQLGRLCGIFGIIPEEPDFVSEALLQVAKCWQFLKWTHVYRYYLPAYERPKKHLLKFKQEIATDLVRKLEKHVQELLQDSLEEDFPFPRFSEFQGNITQLTGVVKEHFDHLTDDLKSGLPEVASSSTPNPSHTLSGGREDEVMNICLPSSAKDMRGVGDRDISKPISRSQSL